MASKNQNKRQSRQVPRLSREEGFNVEEEQKRTPLPPMPEKEEHVSAKENVNQKTYEPSFDFMQSEEAKRAEDVKHHNIKSTDSYLPSVRTNMSDNTIGRHAAVEEYKEKKVREKKERIRKPPVSYTEEQLEAAKKRFHEASVEYTRYKRREGIIGKEKEEDEIVLEDLENVIISTDENKPPEYIEYLAAKEEYNRIKRWFKKDEVKERAKENAKEYDELKTSLLQKGLTLEEIEDIARSRKPFESKATALNRFIEENYEEYSDVVYSEPDTTDYVEQEEEQYGNEVAVENLNEDEIAKVEEKRKFHEKMLQEYPEAYPAETDIFYSNLEAIITDSAVIFPELQDLLMDMLMDSRNSPQDFRHAMFAYNSMPTREVDQMLRFLLYYLEAPLDADRSNNDYMEVANDYMEKLAKMLFIDEDKIERYLDTWQFIASDFLYNRDVTGRNKKSSAKTSVYYWDF